MSVLTGLDVLETSRDLQKKIGGSVACLCHSASVNRNLRFAVSVLKDIFGNRLVRIFAPEHGLSSSLQDMVEDTDSHHPYFNLPVISLYSDTLFPRKEMLSGLDSVIVDLQDVGTRVYTYISTLSLLMERCAESGIHVFVLDRPNPLGGDAVEGTTLDENFKSFVGRHTIPMRHGLTIGEYARFVNIFLGRPCPLEVIPMEGWKRSMYFEETGLPWVLPSPNMPSLKTALVYPGAVMLEGTELSEGRGTTRPFEIFGHPAIEPFSLKESLKKSVSNGKLTGFMLRPLVFKPAFQKHAGKECGGFQIHVSDKEAFKPWKTFCLILRELYHHLGDDFSWRPPPYEYEDKKLPIDIISGSSLVREWIEKNRPLSELAEIEQSGLNEFLRLKKEVVLYR